MSKVTHQRCLMRTDDVRTKLEKRLSVRVAPPCCSRYATKQKRVHWPRRKASLLRILQSPELVATRTVASASRRQLVYQERVVYSLIAEICDCSIRMSSNDTVQGRMASMAQAIEDDLPRHRPDCYYFPSLQIAIAFPLLEQRPIVEAVARQQIESGQVVISLARIFPGPGEDPTFSVGQVSWRRWGSKKTGAEICDGIWELLDVQSDASAPQCKEALTPEALLHTFTTIYCNSTCYVL